MGKMKVHIDLSFSVEDEDKEAEKVGTGILHDQAEQFIRNVHDALDAAGLDIEEVKQTRG